MVSFDRGGYKFRDGASTRRAERQRLRSADVLRVWATDIFPTVPAFGRFARYRLLAVVYTVAWPTVLLGIVSFFLAMYALPYAKCAAGM